MAGKKISRPSWIEWTTRQLAPLTAKTDPPARIALVGIGSELNSDDAAGVAAVRLLRPLFAHTEHVLVVEAGPVAENAAGSLRRFQPDRVILLDAAWFDGLPGEIRGLDWRASEGFSASTHALPLRVFAEYLESEMGCRVYLIGVQVDRVTFDQPMTRPVARAVKKLAQGLHEVLTNES